MKNKGGKREKERSRGRKGDLYHKTKKPWKLQKIRIDFLVVDLNPKKKIKNAHTVQVLFPINRKIQPRLWMHTDIPCPKPHRWSQHHQNHTLPNLNLIPFPIWTRWCSSSSKSRRYHQNWRYFNFVLQGFQTFGVFFFFFLIKVFSKI